jgi:hypothetical protein
MVASSRRLIAPAGEPSDKISAPTKHPAELANFDGIMAPDLRNYGLSSFGRDAFREKTTGQSQKYDIFSFASFSLVSGAQEGKRANFAFLAFVNACIVGAWSQQTGMFSPPNKSTVSSAATQAPCPRWVNRYRNAMSVFTSGFPDS